MPDAFHRHFVLVNASACLVARTIPGPEYNARKIRKQCVYNSFVETDSAVTVEFRDYKPFHILVGLPRIIALGLRKRKTDTRVSYIYIYRFRGQHMTPVGRAYTTVISARD